MRCPVPFTTVQVSEVSATLGDSSVLDSVHAGQVGLLAVALFMILFYRLPGFLAAMALGVYTAITLPSSSSRPVTLTLSGIAAFVLSVGMAVDANILIFERMKEELRRGRTLNTAIDIGFRRAWTSIRDSNVVDADHLRHPLLVRRPVRRCARQGLRPDARHRRAHLACSRPSRSRERS